MLKFVFGRGRMDAMAFFLGHLIGLAGGTGLVITVGHVFGDVALLCFIGGFICFTLYSVAAMKLRFIDIGWNPKWVNWVFFPTLGQLLWLFLFFACILTPSKAPMKALISTLLNAALVVGFVFWFYAATSYEDPNPISSSIVACGIHTEESLRADLSRRSTHTHKQPDVDKPSVPHAKPPLLQTEPVPCDVDDRPVIISEYPPHVTG